MRKIQSILFLKCPKCRKGSLLIGHPYQLRNLNKVNESCSVCQLNFKIETGFFYGSMYVSYGLGVALSITVYIFLSLLGMVDKPPQYLFYHLWNPDCFNALYQCLIQGNLIRIIS